MPKQPTENLVQLINTMSKAEKRHFKLYAKRINNLETTKFIQLFDEIDRSGAYLEERILQRVKSLKKSQLSNLKSHLYKQLLISLRQSQFDKDIDIQVRELLDYSQVLYNKGLYAQSLNLLNKALVKAKKYKRDILELEILHRIKVVDLHYITGNASERALELTEAAQGTWATVGSVISYSGLALRLFGRYMERGYVRNEAEFLEIKQFFNDNLPVQDLKRLSFNERLYFYRAHLWYNYITQNFPMCYRYSQKWVDLVRENQLEHSRSVAYLKGLNSLLTALFRLNHLPKFLEQLQVLERFQEEYGQKSDGNLRLILFGYLTRHRINRHFMEGTFSQGVEELTCIEQELNQYLPLLDRRVVISIEYKIACLYFGNGDYRACLRYLNKIIFVEGPNIRQDIQQFARILRLVSIYELGDDEDLPYQIRTTYHYFGKMEDMNLFQKEIFRFLRSLTRIFPQELKAAFITLRDNLIAISKEPYEQRPFFYFDIISWLDSKIENQALQDIIRENGLGHRKLFGGKTRSSIQV